MALIQQRLFYQCIRKYLLFAMGSLFFKKKSTLLGEDGQEVLGRLDGINIYNGIVLISSAIYLGLNTDTGFSF